MPTLETTTPLASAVDPSGPFERSELPDFTTDTYKDAYSRINAIVI